MKLMRLLSILFALVLVTILAGGSGTAAEKSFPQKPITIIVPRAPGGVVDVASRIIQAPLSKALGTNVVVRNVETGSGNVGQQEVFKAAPDGYKLLASIYPAAAINEIIGKGEYKTKEYTYLYNFASTEGMTLFVADNSPFKTFADFLAAAKKGEVSVSGTGFRSNSFMFLSIRLFQT
jgi:tripartite-type tricarboxylate transporter receptor subunit TctC